MAEIVVYQYPGDTGVESGSPFCVKVHRALAFKGLEYDVKDVGSPGELKRLNPGAAKVPILSYDEQLITDSTAILQFVDEQHPEPPLLPAAEKTLAQCRLLEDWADESLYWFAVYHRWAIDSNFEPFAQRAFGKLPIPVRWLVPRFARKQVFKQLHGQGLGRLSPEEILRAFAGHVAMLATFVQDQPFLTGESLTAADISVFAPLRAASVETMPETAAVVREQPAVIEWLKRVDEETTGEHTVGFSAN